MKYEYRREAAASSTLNAKQLPGLPHDIELDFNHVHVRVHKSEWHDGYFSCSIAIPAHKDDEGYVLELDILDPTRPDEVDKLQEDTAPSLAAEFESGALGPRRARGKICTPGRTPGKRVLAFLPQMEWRNRRLTMPYSRRSYLAEGRRGLNPQITGSDHDNSL